MFQKRSPLVNVSSEVLGLSRNISLLHRLGCLIFFFFDILKIFIPNFEQD